MERYFMVCKPTWYRKAVQIKSMHRFLLTMAVLTLLWVAWLYGVYIKNCQCIGRYQQEIAGLYERRAQATLSMQQATIYEREIKALQDSLYPYYGKESEEKVLVQSCMIELLACIQKSGLQVSGCSVGACIDKGWYIKSPIYFDVMGSIESILRFFSLIKDIRRLLYCSHVLFNRQSDDSFHCNVQIYCISLKEKKIPST